MISLESCEKVPFKIIRGRRIKASMHLDLNENLATNVSNWIKIHNAVISTKEMNWFDHIAYPFAGLAGVHFISQIEHIIVLF